MWARKSSYAGGGPSKTMTAPTCMWLAGPSCARKDASTADSRSPCAWAIDAAYLRGRAAWGGPPPPPHTNKTRKTRSVPPPRREVGKPAPPAEVRGGHGGQERDGE